MSWATSAPKTTIGATRRGSSDHAQTLIATMLKAMPEAPLTKPAAALPASTAASRPTLMRAALRRRRSGAGVGWHTPCFFGSKALVLILSLAPQSEVQYPNE